MKLKHMIDQKVFDGIRQLLRWLNFTRLSAIVTVTCFIFTSVFAQGVSAFAAPEKSTKVVSETLGSFEIPYSVGRITDAKSFSGSKIVVNIQDLHCQSEVQKNISRILSLLDEKYGLKKVYVEGAEGGLDTSWVKDINNEKLRKDVVNSLLEGGRLNGPEYYSITSNKPRLLVGMENKKAYESNIVRLNKIIEGKTGVDDGMMPVMKAEVERVKTLYLSQKNKRLEKLTAQYRAGDITAKKYYKLVTKISGDAGIDINDYQNICKFLNILNMQQQLNYGKITKELNRYLSQLKDQLPYKEYVLLQEKTKDLSRLDELYVVLSRITRNTNFEREPGYNELGKFLEFVDANQKINPMQLVYEEKSLMNELFNRNAQSEGEREVIFVSYFTGLLQDYLNNKISAPDYTAFSRNLSKFTLLWKKYADPDKLIPIEKYTSLFESFYGTNIARNSYFFDNIFGKLPATAETGNNNTEAVLSKLKASPDITVIVAGGFHTPGFTKLLKDKGISYIVITPNVTEDTKLADNVYDQLAVEHAKILSQGLIWGQMTNEVSSLSPQNKERNFAFNTTAAKIQTLVSNNASDKEILTEIDAFVDEWNKAGESQKIGFKSDGKGRYILSIDDKEIRSFQIVGNEVITTDLSSGGEVRHFTALALKGNDRKKVDAKSGIEQRKEMKTVDNIIDHNTNKAQIETFQMTQGEETALAAGLKISKGELSALISQAFAMLYDWQKQGILLHIDELRNKKVVIALLAKGASEHLFEDCLDNGFVGVNEELLEVASGNPKLARQLFVVGLAHELRHEAGLKDERHDLDARYMVKLLIAENIKISDFTAFAQVHIKDHEFISTVETLYNNEVSVIFDKAREAVGSVLNLVPGKVSELVQMLIGSTQEVPGAVLDQAETNAPYEITEKGIKTAIEQNDPDYIFYALNKYLSGNIDKNKIIKFFDVCCGPVDELYKTYTVQATWRVTKAVQQLTPEKRDKLLQILNKHYTTDTEIYASGKEPMPQLVSAIFMLQAKEDYKMSLVKKHDFKFKYGKKIYELMAKQLELEGRCVYTVSPEITAKAGGLGPVMEFLGGGENFILNNLGIPNASNATMELWYEKNGKGDKLDYLLEYGVDIERDASGELKSVVPEYTVDIGGKTRSVRLYRGWEVDKSGHRVANRQPRYFIHDIDGPDGNGTRSASNQLYKYNENERNLANSTKEESVAFLSVAAAESIRQLEAVRQAELGGKWRPAIVHGNDGQCGYLAAVILSRYKNDPLMNNVLHYFTTHTYANRGDNWNPDDMKRYMQFLGIDPKYFNVPMRLKNGSLVGDETSLALRLSDGTNAVAGDHRDDVSNNDLGWIRLVGIPNGGDPEMLGIYYDQSLQEAYDILKAQHPQTYREPLDFDRPATPELHWLAKELAADKLNNAVLGDRDGNGDLIKGIVTATGRKIHLDTKNPKVLSLVVRAVPEKIGRGEGMHTKKGQFAPVLYEDGHGGAFSNENVKALVKAGWQIIIVGGDQGYAASTSVADDLRDLENFIRNEKENKKNSEYKGDFFFIRFLVGDVKKYVFSASNLHAHWTFPSTEANGYTESIAKMALVITVKRKGGNGALVDQGSVVDIKDPKAWKSGNGNTITVDYYDPDSKDDVPVPYGEAFKEAVLDLGSKLDNETDKAIYAQHAFKTPLLNSVMDYFVASWAYLWEMSNIIRTNARMEAQDNKTIEAVVKKINGNEGVINDLNNNGRNRNGHFYFNGQYGAPAKPGLRSFLDKLNEITDKEGFNWQILDAHGKNCLHEYIDNDNFKAWMLLLFDGLNVSSEIEDWFENLKNSPPEYPRKNMRLNRFITKLITALDESTPAGQEAKAAKLAADERLAAEAREAAKPAPIIASLHNNKNLPQELRELNSDQVYSLFFNGKEYIYPPAERIPGLMGLLVNLNKMQSWAVKEHKSKGLFKGFVEDLLTGIPADSKLRQELSGVVDDPEQLKQYLSTLQEYIFDMAQIVQSRKRGDERVEKNIARVMKALTDLGNYKDPISGTVRYYNHDIQEPGNHKFVVEQTAKDKFEPDGKPKPFPGYSVVHNIKKGTEIYDRTVDFIDDLKANLAEAGLNPAWIREHLSFVSPNTLHMTICDVTTWQGQGNPPSAAQESAGKIRGIFEGRKGSEAAEIYSQGLGILNGTTLVNWVYPKSKKDLENINNLNNDIRGALNGASGNRYPFLGHVTLAYIIADMPWADFVKFQGVMRSLENRYLGDSVVDNIGLAEFSDMETWKTINEIELKPVNETTAPKATLSSSRWAGWLVGLVTMWFTGKPTFRSRITDVVDQQLIAPPWELIEFSALFGKYNDDKTSEKAEFKKAVQEFAGRHVDKEGIKYPIEGAIFDVFNAGMIRIMELAVSWGGGDTKSGWVSRITQWIAQRTALWWGHLQYNRSAEGRKLPMTLTAFTNQILSPVQEQPGAQSEKLYTAEKMLSEIEVNSFNTSWESIADIFKLIEDLPFKDSVPLMVRLRAVLLTKSFKGGNIDKLMSNIDGSISRMLSQDLMEGYGPFRSLVSSLPNQGMQLGGIVGNAEELNRFVGDNSTAEDLRIIAHRSISKRLYEEVLEYRKFLTGEIEPGRYSVNQKDMEARKLVMQYLAGNKESMGKEIYEAVVYMEKDLKIIFGEPSKKYILQKLAFWISNNAAVVKNLSEKLSLLKKEISFGENLSACSIITDIRKQIKDNMSLINPSERATVLYLDIFLEDCLTQLVGSVSDELLSKPEANMSNILMLVKLLTANTIYSGWGGQDLNLHIQIIDSYDITYLQLHNLIDRALVDYTDIFGEIDYLFSQSMDGGVQQRLKLTDENMESLRADYVRSMRSYNQTIDFIDKFAQILDSRFRTKGDEFVFEEPSKLMRPRGFMAIDSVSDPAELSYIEGWVLDSYGGKGAFMLLMNSENIPVPSGFIIPTETAKYKVYSRDKVKFDNYVRTNIKKLEKNWSAKYEKITGKQKKFVFNPGPQDIAKGAVPVLVYVRSGSILKMPGILDTVLDVGMNDLVVDALAKEFGKRFAYSTYSRFLRSYGQSIYDIPSEVFDSALSIYKKKINKHLTAQMSENELAGLAEVYKGAIIQALRKNNIDPDEFYMDLQFPERQLFRAISSTLDSWDRKDAVEYRKTHNISHNFFTPVSVMAMVYGNFNEHSGSGVIATRGPKGERGDISGEYDTLIQGEDIVGGFRKSMDIHELEKQEPEIFEKLKNVAFHLDRVCGNEQQIEFTYEDGVLWILQTSRSEVARGGNFKHLKSGYATVARGKPIYGGGFRGMVVFNLNNAKIINGNAKSRGLDGAIYVVKYPKSSDMSKIKGAEVGAMITSEGGVGSHAAAIAIKDKIPAIVGVEELKCDDATGKWMLAGEPLNEGDILSLNCFPEEGFVYRGEVPFEEEQKLEENAIIGILEAAEVAVELSANPAAGVVTVKNGGLSAVLSLSRILEKYLGFIKGILIGKVLGWKNVTPVRNAVTDSINAETPIDQVTNYLRKNIVSLDAQSIKPYVENIRTHLESLKIDQQEIENLISGIIKDCGKNIKNTETVKRLSGELIDIIDDNDVVTGATDRGLAHMLGLRHRTANIIVRTPNGNIILLRRPPSTSLPLHISIPGGHLKQGDTYRSGAEREIVEELHFPVGATLKGNFRELITDNYDVQGDPNKEIRKVYEYTLTESEYKLMQEVIIDLANRKKNSTQQAFKDWLSEQWFNLGEDYPWGYYELSTDSLINANKDDKNLHYLEVEDIFTDETTHQRAYFTDDMLERLFSLYGLASILENEKINSSGATLPLYSPEQCRNDLEAWKLDFPEKWKALNPDRNVVTDYDISNYFDIYVAKYPEVEMYSKSRGNSNIIRAPRGNPRTQWWEELARGLIKETPWGEDKIVNIDNKGPLSVTITREMLREYNDANNKAGRNIWKTFIEYIKIAPLAIAGVRDVMNINDFHDTRYKKNSFEKMLTAVSLALMVRVMYNKDPNYAFNAIAGHEVRYQSKEVREVLSRTLAAMGFIIHIFPIKDPVSAIWLTAIITKIFALPLSLFGTASHSPSIIDGLKLFGPEGSQFLTKNVEAMVGIQEAIIEKIERDGSFTFTLSAEDDPRISDELMSATNRGIDIFREYEFKAAADKSTLELIKNMDPSKVHIDCAHGSAYKTMMMFFERMGLSDVAKKIDWSHAAQRSDFGNLGKLFGKKNDYGADVTQVEEKMVGEGANKKIIKYLPVLTTGDYPAYFAGLPLGDITLHTDMDNDRLAASQVLANNQEIKDYLDSVGVVYNELNNEKLVAMFIPNKFFHMMQVMNFDRIVELMKKPVAEGGLDPDRAIVVLKTLASSPAIDEWAARKAEEGYNIKVVNTAVGFAKLANVMYRTEGAKLGHPGQSIKIMDASGREIDLGTNPIILAAWEESGGISFGLTEDFKDLLGRSFLAGREKSATESIFISLALISKLQGNTAEKKAAGSEQKAVDFAKYLHDLYESDKIDSYQDIRFDNALYIPGSKTAEEDAKIGNAAKNRVFGAYISIVVANMRGELSIEQARTILQDMFEQEYTDGYNRYMRKGPGGEETWTNEKFGPTQLERFKKAHIENGYNVDLKYLDYMLFTGDGVMFYFNRDGKKFSVLFRPSGTDPKLKAYGFGSDLEMLNPYAWVFGYNENSSGKLPDSFTGNAALMKLWGSNGEDAVDKATRMQAAWEVYGKVVDPLDLSDAEMQKLEKGRLNLSYMPPEDHVGMINEWLKAHNIPAMKEPMLDRHPQAMPQKDIISMMEAIPYSAYKALGQDKNEVLWKQGSEKIFSANTEEIEISPEQKQAINALIKLAQDDPQSAIDVVAVELAGQGYAVKIGGITAYDGLKVLFQNGNTLHIKLSKIKSAAMVYIEVVDSRQNKNSSNELSAGIQLLNKAALKIIKSVKEPGFGQASVSPGNARSMSLQAGSMIEVKAAENAERAALVEQVIADANAGNKTAVVSKSHNLRSIILIAVALLGLHGVAGAQQQPFRTYFENSNPLALILVTILLMVAMYNIVSVIPAIIYRLVSNIVKYFADIYSSNKMMRLLKSWDKDEALAYYILMLNDHNPEMVKKTIEFIGKLGNPKGIPALMGSTDNFSERVKALNKLGVDKNLLIEYCTQYINALKIELSGLSEGQMVTGTEVDWSYNHPIDMEVERWVENPEYDRLKAEFERNILNASEIIAEIENNEQLSGTAATNVVSPTANISQAEKATSVEQVVADANADNKSAVVSKSHNLRSILLVAMTTIVASDRAFGEVINGSGSVDPWHAYIYVMGGIIAFCLIAVVPVLVSDFFASGLKDKWIVKYKFNKMERLFKTGNYDKALSYAKLILKSNIWELVDRTCELLGELNDSRAIPILLEGTTRFNSRKAALLKLHAPSDKLIELYIEAMEEYQEYDNTINFDELELISNEQLMSLLNYYSRVLEREKRVSLNYQSQEDRDNFKNNKNKLREKIKYLLVKLDNEQALPLLISMLHNNNYEFLDETIELLNKSDYERAISALIESADNFELRQSTLMKLHAPSKILFEYYVIAVKAGSRNAIPCLGDLGNPQAIPALTESTDDFELRRTALLKLHAGPETLIEFYSKIMNRRNKYEDAIPNAIKYLDDLRDSRAIPKLAESTDNFELRRTALINLNASPDTLFEYYVKAVKNGISSAITYLGDLRDRRAIAVLTEITDDFELRRTALINLQASPDILFKYYVKAMKNGIGSAVSYLGDLRDPRAIPILNEEINKLEKELATEPETIWGKVGSHTEYITGTAPTNGYDYEGEVDDYGYMYNPRIQELKFKIKNVSDIITKLEKNEQIIDNVEAKIEIAPASNRVRTVALVDAIINETRAAVEKIAGGVSASMAVANNAGEKLNPLIAIAPELIDKYHFVFMENTDKTIEETEKRVAKGSHVLTIVPLGQTPKPKEEAVSKAVITVANGNDILVDVWTKKITADYGKSGWVIYYDYQLPAGLQPEVIADIKKQAPLAVANHIVCDPNVQKGLGYGAKAGIEAEMEGNSRPVSIDVVEVIGDAQSDFAMPEGAVRILNTSNKYSGDNLAIVKKVYDVIEDDGNLDVMLTRAGKESTLKTAEQGVSRSRVNGGVITKLLEKAGGRVDADNFKINVLEKKEDAPVMDTVYVAPPSIPISKIKNMDELKDAVLEINKKGVRVFFEVSEREDLTPKGLLAISELGANGLQIDLSSIKEQAEVEKILLLLTKINPDMEKLVALGDWARIESFRTIFTDNENFVPALKVELSTEGGIGMSSGVKISDKKIFYQFKVPDEMNKLDVNVMEQAKNNNTAWGIAVPEQLVEILGPASTVQKDKFLEVLRDRLAHVQGIRVDNYQKAYGTAWNLEQKEIPDLSGLAKDVLIPALNAYSAGNFKDIETVIDSLLKSDKIDSNAQKTVRYYLEQQLTNIAKARTDEKLEQSKAAAGFLQAILERNLCDRYSDSSMPLASRTHQQSYGKMLIEAVALVGLVKGRSYNDALINFREKLNPSEPVEGTPEYKFKGMVEAIVSKENAVTSELQIELEASGSINRALEMIKNEQIKISDPIVITGMISLFNLAQKTSNFNVPVEAKIAVDSVKATMGAG